ncbi:MAG: AAA family ATPase [Candidatus Margulisiibacteriota bacterium]
MDDIIAGRIWAVPWPWAMMNGLCPVLVQEKVVVLCGSPGASKSLMMIQCLNFWAKEGVKASLLELEDSKAEHLQRLLAQVSECSDITDTAWVKANPEKVQEITRRHSDWIDEIGKMIFVNDSADVTYWDLLHWMQERAKAGDRVIVVDPITSASSEGEIYRADKTFINHTLKLAADYKCTIILVTHPRSGTIIPALDNVAGGKSITRHTRGVIWLEYTEEATTQLKGYCGTHDVQINRRMWLLKVSGGKGTGAVLGFRFCPESLQLAEQGLIIKKKKGKRDE